MTPLAVLLLAARSVDGEVATAESAFTQGKHERGLLVYRRADS